MALWTFVAYVVVGLGVALALVARTRASRLRKGASFTLHLALWPLFLPLLLPAPPPMITPGAEAYAAAISGAEKSLADTLRSLGRDLEDPLSIEATRVRALGQAMRTAAARLAELDGLLATPEQNEAALASELARLEQDPDSGGVAEIVEQRLGHVRRLRALRRQSQADLERAIARAAELSTRLTLMRYEDPSRAGAADVRAKELTESIDELCRVLSEARAA